MAWYDFAVYDYFVTTVGQFFAPATDKTASSLFAYGAFAVGFLMRPLRAIVFGHIADRTGRAYSPIWSVVAMAVPSVCTGFLPTYDQSGPWAAALMPFFRILQGVAIGRGDPLHAQLLAPGDE